MADNLKYTHDKYSVFAGKNEMARSYISDEHGGMYAVRVLQGMPHMETWAKIIEDCPLFAKENQMDPNKVPYLFRAPRNKR